MHIRKIAERVAADTGADYKRAYTACRVALEAQPKPEGTRWDIYNVPEAIADTVAQHAAANLDKVGGAAALLLHNIEVVQGDLDAAEQRVVELREARDQAVRDARAAGMPFADLQRATGLSRQRVSKICTV